MVFFKISLATFSFLATVLSIIFMLFPKYFLKIEDFLGLEFGGRAAFNTVLEGKIDIVNDWVFENRLFFGPLLSFLAAINTRNAFFL